MVLPFAGFTQLRSTLNQLEEDDKFIHFGINIGMNISHFQFTHDPLFLTQSPDSVLDIESLNNLGINLAWLVNFNISDHFAVRTYPLDLTFSEKTFQYSLQYPNRQAGEAPITPKSVQSISLTLPVQLEFKSDRIDNIRVYTIAGGQINYDLAATAGSNNNNGTIELNKLDYGVHCGLGFHLYYPYFTLSPELRVDWGLANLHHYDASNKFSNVIDEVHSRMLSFSLTIE